MIRVCADFNDRQGETYWNLHFDGLSIGQMESELVLRQGLRVILFQDEDDFEVEATLGFERVDVLQRESWVARPDWPTMVRFEDTKAKE